MTEIWLSSSYSAWAEFYPPSSCLLLFLIYLSFENKESRSSACAASYRVFCFRMFVWFCFGLFLQLQQTKSYRIRAHILHILFLFKTMLGLFLHT